MGLDEIYRRGTVDEVSGLPNRRAFGEALEREVERAVRYSRPLSLALLAIDGLEEARATSGDEAADFLVKSVGDVISGRAREVDLVARFSDTALAVALPEVPVEGARALAETLRGLVAQQALMFGGQRYNVTVTVALATVVGPDGTAGALVDEAEQGLLRAQAGGTNRVLGPGEPGPDEAG